MKECIFPRQSPRACAERAVSQIKGWILAGAVGLLGLAIGISLIGRESSPAEEPTSVPLHSAREEPIPATGSEDPPIASVTAAGNHPSAAAGGEAAGTREPSASGEAAVPPPSRPVLSGIVRDALTGVPIENFRVRIVTVVSMLGDSSQEVLLEKNFSGGDGRFRIFHLPASSGALQARIETSRHLPALLNLGTDTGNLQEFEVVLFPSAMLSGRVIWADTMEPVAAAKVTCGWLHPEASHPAEPAFVTGSQGVFHIVAPAVSDVVLRVSHPRAVLAERRFRLQQGERRHLGDIALVPASKLVLHLRKAGGTSVADADIVVSVVPSLGDPEADATTRTLQTDASGTVVFERLPPGAASITVALRGRSPRTLEDVELPPRSTREIQLELPPERGTLSGRITTSRPVSGRVRLVLFRRLATGDFEQIDAVDVSPPGPYAFENLEAGTYKVEGVVSDQERTFRGSREIEFSPTSGPVDLNIRIGS